MLKTLGKDVAIYGGVDFLFRFTQLLAIPIYAHLLSLADFGILSLLTVTATLLGMLAALGVNNSIQRFYFDPEIGEAQRPTLISTGLLQLLAMGLLVTAAALLLSFPLRPAIENGLGIPWIMALVAIGIILPEQLSQYLLDAVRLQFSPLKFVAVALIKNFGAVLLGLLLVVQFDMGVLGLLLGIVIAGWLAVPVGLLMLRQNLTRRFDNGIWRTVLRYGYPFVLTGAAYWVFGSVGNWMLGLLGTTADVGMFAIGMKFAVVMTFVISAFAQAWGPFALRMYGEDPDYLIKWARIFSAWFLVLALAGLGLALFAPEIMRLLTPPEYWPASDVLAICAVGLVFYGTVQMTVLGVSISKRTILLNYAAWLAAITAVLVDLALIPRFGAIGAAAATMSAYAVLTSALLFWTQRLHPLPLERGKLGYSLLLTAGALLWTFTVPAMDVSLGGVLAKLSIIAAAAAGGIAVGIVDWRLLASLTRRGRTRSA